MVDFIHRYRGAAASKDGRETARERNRRENEMVQVMSDGGVSGAERRVRRWVGTVDRERSDGKGSCGVYGDW